MARSPHVDSFDPEDKDRTISRSPGEDGAETCWGGSFLRGFTRLPVLF